MSYVLKDWQPEDKDFWAKKGKAIARRNLWLSIFSLLLSFAIWQMWSVVVVYLPAAGFNYTANELSWLIGLPALSGATLRIVYSFIVPIFGGRRWTAFSTMTLLLPALGLGFAVQNPDTPYSTMMILALLCGFGSGNFSSSMANISFFFPKAEKGTALGLNAGLGNLGVSVMQVVIPAVVGLGLFGALGGAGQTYEVAGVTQTVWLQNAGFVWVPFILVSGVLAWFGMNDIASMKASFSEQSVIFTRKHNWLMCWLYLGTFGSFIGFSAGFPFLMKSQFVGVDALKLAFLGPLVGAIARPFGGWLSDKIGGARVTHWVFLLMMLAVVGVLLCLPSDGVGGSFMGFFICFLILFALTGIGNGSTFMQVPAIFSKLHEARVAKGEIDSAQAQKDATKEGAAVLGFSAALAAYGGFFIPKSYGTALALTGSVAPALMGFIVFYATCVGINWWYYARKGSPTKC